jgi:FkbM family methyltransferase
MIQELWNGDYKGLYGEVVTGDIYKIRQLKFTPDVIFDLGANVGTFSVFARELFPDAIIIAVEPNEQNIKYFNEYNDPVKNNINLLECAIGKGQVYRDTKAINGSHEVYVSDFLGYEKANEAEDLKENEVKTIMLSDICHLSDKKYMIKIDIEGAETALFMDEPSLRIIKNADYVAIELHYFALTHEKVLEVKKVTDYFMEAMKETHDTVYEHPIFYATKR